MSEAAPVAAEPVAAAPAPAAAPTPAAPAAPAESLIHGTPAGSEPAAAPPAPADPAAAPAPASDDPFAGLFDKVPEKFHVKDGEKLNHSASIAKALEHREHLEKRLSSGDLPPKKADEYQWQPPKEWEGFELDNTKTAAFKDEALKRGVTAETYKWMMDTYIGALPDLMQGAAKLNASQARAELQKVWQQPGDMEVGLGNAERALKHLPTDLQDSTREFGTNPAFLRAMAHFGAQMREDKAPVNPSPPADNSDIKTLEASKAYMDPKHPEHNAVSQKVQAYYSRIHGSAPI
jgi:hypothetical protein